jgi:hemolysin III
VLLARAAGADQMVAFSVFGLSLIALYTASALYHLLPLSSAGVARLRRVDHMMIFVLIAGTYTPFCLLALDGAWRAGLLILIWGLALCGILLKLFWMGASRWLSLALYLGMGWVAVIAAPALFQAVPTGGTAWVLAEPDARGVRVSRGVASVRHGGERLPFLGGAALRRAACLKARA